MSASTASLTTKWVIGLALLLAFIFTYPRLLAHYLGEENPWASYLYLYGFGLIYFGSGMVLIRKTGACVPGRGRDTFWWNVMLAGFVFFASLHAVWIYLSLSIPFKGGL